MYTITFPIKIKNCLFVFLNGLFIIYYQPCYHHLHIACENGTFGIDCNQTCGKCLENSVCNRVNGTCGRGCDAGYIGDLCKTRTFKDKIKIIASFIFQIKSFSAHNNTFLSWHNVLFTSLYHQTLIIVSNPATIFCIPLTIRMFVISSQNFRFP